MSKYIFKLYAIQNSSSSLKLLNRIKTVFDEVLKDEYSIEVIDILKHPQEAIDKKILASPTLVMELPSPEKRIIGEFTDKESLLINLNLLVK